MPTQLIDASDAATGRISGRPADPISRRDFEGGRREQLREGRWANVVRCRIEHRGSVWVFKDFRGRSFLARNVLGRFLLAREMRGLRSVAGIEGPPREVLRVDAFSLAYRFVPGTSLRNMHGTQLGVDFFPALERTVQRMHTCARIVHLDLRNGDNILVTEEGTPAVLDFQSHVSTRWMPGPLRRFAQQIDLGAIYKHWAKLSPETLGTTRAAVLTRISRLRPLWVLSGRVGTRKSGRYAAR
jgi:hypothetical protein